MQVVETIEALRAARAELPPPVGLVPTMGYLHAGHLSLLAAARAENRSVVATIFVNPTQFGPDEDLDSYPRDPQRDLDLIQEAGVDLVFLPSAAVMYPPDFQTYVTVEEVTQGQEGAARPGHFRGVATVVAKLFNLAQPDYAYFGQKDAQQVVVIRRMAHDLNMPLSIVVCPVVREEDGLALSSRNVYLSPERRSAAAVLYRGLRQAAGHYDAGQRDPEHLRAVVRQVLDAEPLIQLEYVSVALARTMQEVTAATEQPLVLSAAAWVGHTRLIDNVLLPFSLNTRDRATRFLGAV